MKLFQDLETCDVMFVHIPSGYPSWAVMLDIGDLHSLSLYTMREEAVTLAILQRDRDKERKTRFRQESRAIVPKKVRWVRQVLVMQVSYMPRRSGSAFRSCSASYLYTYISTYMIGRCEVTRD